MVTGRSRRRSRSRPPCSCRSRGISCIRPRNAKLATRKVWNFVDFEPKLKEMAMHPKLLRVVELLLGAKPQLVDDAALLKPPHSGQEKPWHQDMAYRGLDYDRRIIGVWIALDEADADNGCMHVIPRSHMNGATPHYSVRDGRYAMPTLMWKRTPSSRSSLAGVLFFHGMSSVLRAGPRPSRGAAAPSRHTPSSGVTCGRPSGRTVDNQYSSASSSSRRPRSQAVGPASGLLNELNSVTGSCAAIWSPCPSSPISPWHDVTGRRPPTAFTATCPTRLDAFASAVASVG